MTAEECRCGLDGERRGCVDGAVYGPCGDENCGGVCEYESDCGHECHTKDGEPDA